MSEPDFRSDAWRHTDADANQAKQEVEHRQHDDGDRNKPHDVTTNCRSAPMMSPYFVHFHRLRGGSSLVSLEPFDVMSSFRVVCLLP